MAKFEITFNEEQTTESLHDGYMSFKPKGTQDMEIPPASFMVKLKDGTKKVVTAITKKDKGVVLDIHNMKTGWSKFDNGRPDWVFNDDLKNWKPKPDADYKQGISIPVAIGEDKMFYWTQSGVSVIEAFKHLSPQINGKPMDKLPRVYMEKAEPLQFKVGGTVVPKLKVIDWVTRPFILEVDQDKNKDTSEEVVVLPADSEF